MLELRFGYTWPDQSTQCSLAFSIGSELRPTGLVATMKALNSLPFPEILIPYGCTLFLPVGLFLLEQAPKRTIHI